MRRWTALALVAALALGLSACGSDTPSSGSGTSTTSGAPAHISTVPDGNITVYSGQHEQTVSQLVSAFEAKTGVKVKVRSDDEGSLAHQLLAEGSATPADVFYAENPPALNVLDAKGLLSRTARRRRWPGCRRSSTRRRGTGSACRRGPWRWRTTPTQLQPSQLPSVDPRPRRARLEGQGRHRARRDRLPAPRHHHHPAEGRAAAEAWLEGHQGQQQGLRRQRVADRGREPGRGRHRHRRPLLLVPPARRGRSRARCTRALHYFAPGDPGALIDVSGAGQTASSKHPGSAQAFLAFLVSRDGAADHRRPARATSTRSRRAWSAPRACDRSPTSAPRP